MAYSLADLQRNATFAMNFFVAKGYNAKQAASIVGNLLAESNLNPDTKPGDKGTAQGIAQWRNDRQVKFLEVIGVTIQDSNLEEQLTFVAWELSNTHKKANRLLLESTTIEAGAEAIDKYYERSFGEHLQKRIDLAKAQYEAFTNQPVEQKAEQDIKLDEEVEHSMDASDPPSQTQPGTIQEPVPSSGFPEKKPQSIWQIIVDLLRSIFKEK